MKTKSEKICMIVLAAILAISVLSVIPTPVGAQPVEMWNITWGGAGEDEGCAMAITGDSVYLAGSDAHGAFLNKYDKEGNLLWNITWGTYLDEGRAIATLGDNVYLAGDTRGAFLNKYDKDGNLIWNITWGGICTHGWATATSGDSVYLAGGNDGAFLNKYDKDGNLIWNTTWGGIVAEGRATATGDGAVYLAGENDGAFLNKYDEDGNLIWNITCGGILAEGGAIATSEDSVYLAGSDAHGAFLNKYDEDGNFIWNITCRGIGTSGMATATSKDSVYLAGGKWVGIHFFDCIFLNKYDHEGKLIWNITRGLHGRAFPRGCGRGRAIATTGDSVYLAGEIISSVANGTDAFLVKYSEPTPTPTKNVTEECKTLWYFDEQSVKCQQDEFCGLYMYKGLHTFETEEECKAALETYLQEEKEETPTPSPTPPGFEAGFAIAGLLAVAYLMLIRRK
ncbi:hypothetical protein C5S32_05495 [ANME-1 cluster archaeon GoMg1]|nr:hypothetical protein [ANME-1 cluster archaeon GoMg1]